MSRQTEGQANPDDETYEQVRAKVTGLSAARRREERALEWVEADCLAVSRDENGAVELFIVGEQLFPAIPVVDDRLKHQEWSRADGEPLLANRLVLSDAPQFDRVAAFLCTELLAQGLGSNPARAFAVMEPVIALALRRLSLGDEVLLGLAGELVLLEALILRSPPGAAAVLVDRWAGSMPSTRDFQLGSVGVEVKTTTGTASRHHIAGVHQTELGHAMNGSPESSLYLLSLGVTWLPTDARDGQTIPGLADSILSRLPDTLSRDRFLAKLLQYGGDPSVGYDHRAPDRPSRYDKRFMVRFERLYDLADPAVSLPGSADLVEFLHLEVTSVSFTVALPPQVRGDLNPISGMNVILDRLVGSTGVQWWVSDEAAGTDA